MADVGRTLAFDDLVVGTSLPAGLPAYIPQVDGHDVGAFDEDLAWAAYGLGLRRVYSPDSLRVYPRFAGVDVQQALGVEAHELALAIYQAAYGPDHRYTKTARGNLDIARGGS